MTQRKKIFIAANATLGEGGQGLNLQHMFEGLATSGDFDIEIFCAGGTAPVPIHVIPRARWVDKLFGQPIIRRFGEWHAYLSDISFDREVARRLTQCDLFQGVTGQALRSLRRARSMGAKTLLDVVTVHVDDGNTRVAKECARLGIQPRLHRGHVARQRSEYAEADAIRVMSTHARNTFIEHGTDPSKIFSLNPFLDISGFPRATFDDSVFRVCFVGRLVIGKGFHHLIQAFQEGHLKASELILWGGTGERAVHLLLQSLLKGTSGIHVRPVPIRSVGLDQVYGRAHVFVHPSLADGFGYSVAESMACGLPVIVTRTTGAADWVRHGVNGFIIEPGDVSALRQHLEWCQNNVKALPAMGEAARQSVAEQTLERFRDRYLPEVHALLGV